MPARVLIPAGKLHHRRDCPLLLCHLRLDPSRIHRDGLEMGWCLYGKLHYVEEEGELLPILPMERFEETSEPMDVLIF